MKRWIIFYIVLVSCIGCNNKERSVQLELENSSQVTIVYNPFIGKEINLKIGEYAMLNKILSNIKEENIKYVIDNNIINIDDDLNKIVGLKEGIVNIKLITKDKKIESNTIKLNVIK